MFNGSNGAILWSLFWGCVIALAFVLMGCGDTETKPDNATIETESMPDDPYQAELVTRMRVGVKEAFRTWARYQTNQHPIGAKAYWDALKAYEELKAIWVAEGSAGYERAAMAWKEARYIAIAPYMDAHPSHSSKAQRIHNCEIVYFGVIP